MDPIFVVEGCGEAYVNGKWEEIGPGDYIFAPATEEHGIKKPSRGPLRLFVHHSPPLL